MALDITSIRRRLSWTERQIRRLEVSYARFLPNLERNHIVVVIESERRQVIRVKFDWSLPDWWGIAVGEVVHHLRSCLDNLVWQVVAESGGTPSDTHEFPIARDRQWFEKVAPRKLRGVPAEALEIIRRVQPYNRPQGQPLEEHAFWGLNQLDIVDKHHLLHVAVTSIQTVEQSLSEADIQAGMVVTVLFPAELHDGAPIMSLDFDEPRWEKVVMGPSATLAVQIARTGRTPALAFPHFLRVLHLSTTNVVEAISDRT